MSEVKRPRRKPFDLQTLNEHTIDALAALFPSLADAIRALPKQQQSIEWQDETTHKRVKHACVGTIEYVVDGTGRSLKRAIDRAQTDEEAESTTDVYLMLESVEIFQIGLQLGVWLGQLGLARIAAPTKGPGT